MFFVTFYIFSLLLSYTDYKSFLVPNAIVSAMSILMLFFGIIEDKIDISSVVLMGFVLLFFILLLLLNPKMVLGGGDIKYMLLSALYLGIYSFALFLIVTGILQSAGLLYRQKIQKRHVLPMVPFMFSSVIIVEILNFLGLSPLSNY